MDKPKKTSPSEKDEIEDQLFDVSNLASAGDCTGLITHGIPDDDEIENYQDLYPFLPPNIGAKDEKKRDSD